MKGERLFHLLGLIDDGLILEADAPAVRRGYPPRSLLAAAACLAVVVLGGFWWLSGSGQSSTVTENATTTEETPETTGEVGETTDVEPVSAEGSSFMSYAGPVFPLSLVENTAGLTAERETLWDFAPGRDRDGSARQWGAEVTDSYVLINHSTGDILALASYPVAGTLESLSMEPPTLSVNGGETDWDLYAGAYAGGFQDADENDGSTWNLSPPDDWTDYIPLLVDGSYFKEALDDAAPLTQEVVVYEFSDFTAPAGYDAATQAVSFTIDEDRTQILTYGFNGGSRDETGWRQYDYFVPRAIREASPSKFLIVLGEDIRAVELQGYVNGSCDENEKLPGVSCKVRRYESSLDAVIETLCQLEAKAYLKDFHPENGFANLFDFITPELYESAVTDLLTRYGPLAEDGGTDRYADGRLDELLQEVLHQERVLYLVFPVTVPAGGGTEVTVSFRKEPSFDFGVSGGAQGFDLVTTLGSSLSFTHQTAAIVNTEGVEIVEQNLGLDPERGITEVTLAPESDHYYLVIRPKAE